VWAATSLRKEDEALRDEDEGRGGWGCREEILALCKLEEDLENARDDSGG
jgi:hypothetical protein